MPISRSLTRRFSILATLLIHLISISVCFAVSPIPPDVLELVTSTPDAAGDVEVEAVVKNAIEASVELQITEVDAAKKSTQRLNKALQLKRSLGAKREKVAVKSGDGKHRTIKARLTVLNADNTVQLVVDKAVEVNKPVVRIAKDDERVAVILNSPDGTKIVERMSRKEARQRGLKAVEDTATPSSTTSQPQGAGGAQR